MKWTLQDLEKKKLSHNYKPDEIKKNTSLPKIEKVSVEKQTIKALLWTLNREGTIPEYVEELQFHPVRKYRFDWAIPSLKIAIEYEGIFSKKSGHTTVSGYTKDCDKYNLATVMGWKILRYTAKNYNNLGNDLKSLLKK